MAEWRIQMANLVESIIDKVKSDKIELSQTDRHLLQKLSASIDALKSKKTITESQLTETEERLNTQIKTIFASLQEQASLTAEIQKTLTLQIQDMQKVKAPQENLIMQLQEAQKALTIQAQETK